MQLKDYVKYVRRASPTWGKRFGEVHKPRVGRFGAFTTDDAKLCLLTEDQEERSLVEDRRFQVHSIRQCLCSLPFADVRHQSSKCFLRETAMRLWKACPRER